MYYNRPMKKIDYIIFVSLIVIFLALTGLVVFVPQIAGYEWKIIKAVQGLMSFASVYIPRFFSGFGYIPLVAITFLISAAILVLKREYITLLCLGSMSYSVFHVSELVKNLIGRPRPPVDLQVLLHTNPSFPSGHSLVNACVFTFVIYMVMKYVQNKALKITLTTLCVLWILFIGFSRIWLGVHHPTDVLAGYVFGVFYAYIFITVDRIWNAAMKKPY